MFPHLISFCGEIHSTLLIHKLCKYQNLTDLVFKANSSFACEAQSSYCMIHSLFDAHFHMWKQSCMGCSVWTYQGAVCHDWVWHTSYSVGAMYDWKVKGRFSSTSLSGALAWLVICCYLQFTVCGEWSLVSRHSSSVHVAYLTPVAWYSQISGPTGEELLSYLCALLAILTAGSHWVVCNQYVGTVICIAFPCNFANWPDPLPAVYPQFCVNCMLWAIGMSEVYVAHGR